VPVGASVDEADHLAGGVIDGDEVAHAILGEVVSVPILLPFIAHAGQKLVRQDTAKGAAPCVDEDTGDGRDVLRRGRSDLNGLFHMRTDGRKSSRDRVRM